MPVIHAPTKDRAVAIRADLKALGVRANVRFFRFSFRIVLPVHTAEAAAAVRDYLVEQGLGLAGGHSATDPVAYRNAWSLYDGRGQLFAYDVR
jgi:hypothetical protein